MRAGGLIHHECAHRVHDDCVTTVRHWADPANATVQRPVIWVFEVIPNTPNDNDYQCDPNINEAIAKATRTLPGFISSAWNRQRAEVVFEYIGALGDRRPAMGLVVDRILAVDPRSDGRRLDRSYDIRHWPDPCDWDFLLAPTEVAARVALQGRHQCGQHNWCGCDRVGNEFDPKQNDTIPLGSFGLPVG